MAMICVITVGAQIKLIGDLQDEKYTLVDLSQDVEAIHEHFGNHKDVTQFDGFLVEVLDGEYGEVWGFSGNVPYNNKDAELVEMQLFPAGENGMFEALTLNRRFRYYEACNGFYIERLSDGEVKGIGDGVGMFWDEKDQESIPVGTVRFYQEFAAQAVNEDEDTLEEAYFG